MYYSFVMNTSTIKFKFRLSSTYKNQMHLIWKYLISFSMHMLTETCKKFVMT